MHVPGLAFAGQPPLPLPAALHCAAVKQVPVALQTEVPDGQIAWHAPAGPALGFQVLPFGHAHSSKLFTTWVGAQQMAAMPGRPVLHWC
jgi:hypothetical protein